MIKIINSGPTHNVKRLSDGKLFKVRCCKIQNGIEGDFDIIFQYYEDGKWLTDNNICSPKFTFHVDDVFDDTTIINKKPTAMNKKKRYNLNYRIRKQGFELRGKTILLPADKEPSKQVVKLQNEFHYSIQHTIV